MTKGPRKVKLVIVVNKKDPPTFKTLTPTSRTQLKQQLMREHAQEQLRREAAPAAPPRAQQREPQRDAPPAPAALRVPPQVLQVRTALENPTRYHVIQKQQSQVRQYLSESFRSAPAATSPSPDCDFASASPEMCSVTTSNSETDDFLDDILSLESGGAAGEAGETGEPGGVKRESLPLSDAEMHAMAKDRQKKDNHNMIERRRRFNINDRIKELGALLPKTDDPFYEVIRDVRPNKGTILKSSVDYIKCLREEVDKLKRGELRRRQTELHNRKLLLRVQELERTARLHGLPAAADVDLHWQPPRDEPRYVYSAPASRRTPAATERGVPSSLPAEETRLSTEAALECLQLDGSAMAAMLPEMSPTLLLEGGVDDASSALNLSQMEDLMEDDPRDGRIAQGDPMLCSSPSTGLRLDGDEAQRAAIESMLADEGAMFAPVSVDSATLDLLGSSGLLGPGRSRGGRDRFSDADMELGV